MLTKEEASFYVRVFKDLSLIDIAELLALAQTKILKAGAVYIPVGSISYKLAYIKTGLFRAYYLKPNGDEVTMMLRWEGQFMASIDSIIYHKPSRFIYQALEDTVILEIDYKKAQAFMDKKPTLSSARSSLLLDMLAQAMERVESFLLLSPQERYLELLSERSDLANRVSDKHLATLLGITPVSLSRIRRRIASQRKR